MYKCLCIVKIAVFILRKRLEIVSNTKIYYLNIILM